MDCEVSLFYKRVRPDRLQQVLLLNQPPRFATSATNISGALGVSGTVKNYLETLQDRISRLRVNFMYLKSWVLFEFGPYQLDAAERTLWRGGGWIRRLIAS